MVAVGAAICRLIACMKIAVPFGSGIGRIRSVSKPQLDDRIVFQARASSSSAPSMSCILCISRQSLPICSYESQSPHFVCLEARALGKSKRCIDPQPTYATHVLHTCRTSISFAHCHESNEFPRNGGRAIGCGLEITASRLASEAVQVSIVWCTWMKSRNLELSYVKALTSSGHHRQRKRQGSSGRAGRIDQRWRYEQT